MDTIKVATVKMVDLKDINFVKGNRKIYNKHVEKMYKLIGKYGFADTIKVVPIEGKYYAVEGQHRVRALMQHNIKQVPCSIVDWLGEDIEEIHQFIISLNAHNKQWSLIDDIKSWADLDKKDYVYLLDKINANKTLSVGSVVSCYDGVRRQHTRVKKGMFKIKDRKFSDHLLNKLTEFVDKVKKKKANSKITYCAAEKIFNSTDRYDVLEAFLMCAETSILADQTLPDGDKIFDSWWDNQVLGIYLPMIKKSKLKVA